MRKTCFGTTVIAGSALFLALFVACSSGETTPSNRFANGGSGGSGGSYCAKGCGGATGSGGTAGRGGTQGRGSDASSPGDAGDARSSPDSSGDSADGSALDGGCDLNTRPAVYGCLRFYPPCCPNHACDSQPAPWVCIEGKWVCSSVFDQCDAGRVR
jgi:hypothetical protein